MTIIELTELTVFDFTDPPLAPQKIRVIKCTFQFMAGKDLARFPRSFNNFMQTY